MEVESSFDDTIMNTIMSDSSSGTDRDIPNVTSFSGYTTYHTV